MELVLKVLALLCCTSYLVMFALLGRCLHSAVMRAWALTEVESAEPLRLHWGAGPESNDFPKNPKNMAICKWRKMR